MARCAVGRAAHAAADADVMHILFFVTSTPLLRHFTPTLTLLTSSGVSLTVAAPQDPRGRGLARPLADDPSVRLLHFEPARDPELDSAVTLLRLTRDSFRDTPETRHAIRAMLSSLSERYALVHLDTGLRLDDHAGPGDAEGLRLAGLDIPPARNLEVQTAVIARARAFVGTYGGLAYLPPFLGVPSISFYTEPPRKYARHLSLAHEVFADTGWGAFVPLDLRRAGGLGALSSALARLAEWE